MSSSGYFFGRAMRSEDPLPPGQHPGFKVSVKPSLPQGDVIRALLARPENADFTTIQSAVSRCEIRRGPVLRLLS